MLFAALALGVGQVGLLLALLIYALAQIAGGLSMIRSAWGSSKPAACCSVAVGVDPSVAAAVCHLPGWPRSARACCSAAADCSPSRRVGSGAAARSPN